MSKTIKKRDPHIKKSYDKEIDLSTRSVKSKKQYSRKDKYPFKDY